MCLSILTQMYAATSASQLPSSVLQEGSNHVPFDTDIDISWSLCVRVCCTPPHNLDVSMTPDSWTYWCALARVFPIPYLLQSIPLVLNPALP